MVYELAYGIAPQTEIQREVISHAEKIKIQHDEGRRLPIDLVHFYLMLKRKLREIDVNQDDVMIELSFTPDKRVLVRNRKAIMANVLLIITEEPWTKN